jgi:hypothetical protein
MEQILQSLAEDLRDRGKLDLTEGFIDGTHAGAKKGGLVLERLAEGRPPRSWQLQTALVLLSPLGLRVVSAMTSSSSTKPETPLSSTSFLNDSSETWPSTATNSIVV